MLSRALTSFLITESRPRLRRAGMSSSVLALLEPSLPGMLTTAATAQIARYVIDSRPCVRRAIVYCRTAADGTHSLGTKQHGHPAAQACKALPRFGGACVSAGKGFHQCSES